jgi:hypothetical protein
MFISMRLQWLLYDALKALSIKDAFSKGVNGNNVIYRWSTTTFNATTEMRFDIKLLCETLMANQNHPVY